MDENQVDISITRCGKRTSLIISFSALRRDIPFNFYGCVFLILTRNYLLKQIINVLK